MGGIETKQGSEQHQYLTNVTKQIFINIKNLRGDKLEGRGQLVIWGCAALRSLQDTHNLLKTETLRMASWTIIGEHGGWSVLWLKARNRKEQLTLEVKIMRSFLNGWNVVICSELLMSTQPQGAHLEQYFQLCLGCVFKSNEDQKLYLIVCLIQSTDYLRRAWRESFPLVLLRCRADLNCYCLCLGWDLHPSFL